MVPRLSSHRLVVAFAALGGFLFGYDTSVINAALFLMRSHFGFDLESWEAGLIVSIAIAGAFVGSFAAGIGATAFGRRKAIAAADILFIGGTALLSWAPSIWVLLAGRFVIGLGIGVASVMIPVYLAEVTPAETRGRVITLNNAFITGGQFIAAGVGAAFIYVFAEGDSVGWRLMFALGALPAAAQLIGIALLPESPRWLALHGRVEEAILVADRIGIDIAISAHENNNNTSSETDNNSRSVTVSGQGDDRIPVATSEREPLLNECPRGSTPYVISRLVNSSSNAAGEHSKESEDPYVNVAGGSSSSRVEISRRIAISETRQGKAVRKVSTVDNLRRIFSAKLRRRLLIGAGLQLFQQLSGINTIMYYSSTILRKAGFGDDKDPVVLSVPLAFTNGLFTLVGMVFIERWGRRPLLLVSLLGCAVATVGMTIVGFLLDGGMVTENACGWAFLGLLAVYLAFFAPGMGPIPWVVNAEIYPNSLRSDAASVATMVNWASNALVSQLFPMLLGFAGSGPTFASITGFVLIGVMFVYWFVPETKEVPLESMGEVFGDLSNEDEEAGAEVNTNADRHHA